LNTELDKVDLLVMAKTMDTAANSLTHSVSTVTVEMGAA